MLPALLFLAFVPVSRPVIDVFTHVANALSEGDAVRFMQPFDRSTPDYEKLQAQVTALLVASDVQASIEFLEDSGDDNRRSVTLDFSIQIKLKEATGPVVRRRQAVKFRLEKRGKKWLIVSLEPLEFFAPLSPGC
jgi:hypothetical protein